MCSGVTGSYLFNIIHHCFGGISNIYLGIADDDFFVAFLLPRMLHVTHFFIVVVIYMLYFVGNDIFLQFFQP